ncbi:MAG: ABC transporter permease [Eubacterium sp.]|nr:ABC transporter permease [Eubacterium sp.]
MIRYLIKNNFKLMGRNIVNILLFIFAPIAVMAILISAFSGLMDKYKSVDKFKIGYSIEEGSIFESRIDSINSILSKQGIDCVKIDTDNPKECIDNNGFGGYVEYKKDIYKIHLSDDKKVEGKTFEYIISAYVENMGLAMFSNISDDKVQDMDFEFTESHPDHMPEISSTDYYGIIWIIYFSWCAILCLTGIYNSEKKHDLLKKYRVSNLSELQIYLSRFIPSVVIICLCLVISMVLSMFALGVHWGEIPLSLLIVICSSLAALAFGIMVQAIFDSMVVTIIVVFGCVWFMGFYGGTFEAFMFQNIPNNLNLLSPLYHANRAAVELSTMGHSDYVVSAICYTLFITFVCSVVAVFAGIIRKRGRA